MRIKGHGTYANDLVPIVGTLGRQSKQVRLRVVQRTDRQTLCEHVTRFTQRDAIVYIDEWMGYNELPRQHFTVKHRTHEWTRDEDNDGRRELHVNGLEGF